MTEPNKQKPRVNWVPKSEDGEKSYLVRMREIQIETILEYLPKMDEDSRLRAEDTLKRLQENMFEPLI